MTPESAERLSAWRAEIAGELEEATKELPTFEAEHTAAIAAAGAAESAHRDMQKVLDAAFTRLTGPLALRVAWLRSQWDDSRGRVARAHGALEAARSRVAELKRAVQQLDHVIPVVTEEAA